MQRKDYNRPTMQVVELRNENLLSESGSMNASRSGYGAANSDVDDREKDASGQWSWE